VAPGDLDALFASLRYQAAMEQGLTVRPRRPRRPAPPVRPEFMRVARSFALQESRVLRAYARAGRTVICPDASARVFDEALELVSRRDGLRVWRAMWLPRGGAPGS
jgi:hypothetical protein